MTPEEALLMAIEREQANVYEVLRAATRNQRVLVQAATRLRVGFPAHRVISEIREECPELLETLNGPTPAPV